MQVPLEVSFRDVERTPAIDELITDQVDKLERVCNYLTSCRIVIEKPQKYMQSGSRFRVRIDLTLPPGHEIVAKRNAGEGDIHDDLSFVIRDVFDAARRQLQTLMEKQRRDVKNHFEPSSFGLIATLFKDQGYGFIDAADGRSLYFHKNSVINSEFDRLAVGTPVRFFEELGEQGPQASTVQVTERPGTPTTPGREETQLQ